ncbi:MAG TPA: hypothetical protein VHE58_04265 [Burkholderiales bacterium]|nr:hypothetical protein [Burkholderiales bacterium]
MGSRLGVIRQFLTDIRSAGRERFAGLFDLSYLHYALGDALTAQMNIACLAREAGCTGIDLCLFVDPVYPAAQAQDFINRYNYPVHLDNLFPAFLCLPGLSSIRLVRDSVTAGLILCSLAASRTPMWPSLHQHLRRRMTYPMSHDIINRFYAREGFVPQLAAPRGYGRWAREFLLQHWPDRFVVCINPRQSRLNAIPAATYRDSPLNEWHAFIDTVADRYPDVHFLMLGGFHEWESVLTRRPNVSIPRVMGLTLAHELALLRSADLFMGASSGFSTMATFTDVPYVITNYEHLFASVAGVEVNAPRYPFATEHQHLVWLKEDAALLMKYFEAVYHRLQPQE